MRSLTGVSMRRRVVAVEDVEAATTPGVDRFHAWVHEANSAMQCEPERLGYTLDEAARAMGHAT